MDMRVKRPLNGIVSHFDIPGRADQISPSVSRMSDRGQGNKELVKLVSQV